MNGCTVMSQTGLIPRQWVNTQRLIRIGVLVILIAFGAGGAWAALAPLASAIIASGVVKVANNRKTVQHLEGGVINQILVRDGDHVVAGQPLIVLEDEQISGRLDFLVRRLDVTSAKAARLQAERDDLAQPQFPQQLLGPTAGTKAAEILLVEKVLFQTKRLALESQLELLSRQGAEINEEIDSLKSQLQAEEAASSLLVEELKANEKLLKQRAVAQLVVLPLQRGVEEYLSRRGKINAAIARARQRELELRLRATALHNRYTQKAAEELSAVNAVISDLEERIRLSHDAIRRQLVVAPITGEVVALKVFTVGGVVSSGEHLLDIAPDKEPLIIEARIDIDDIDSVRPGMRAQIRLTAYPARATPFLSGVLTYLSADQFIDQNSAVPYFLAHVSVEPDSLATVGEVQLYPGMHAEVFLEAGKRTALAYLLAPVTASLDRALREP